MKWHKFKAIIRALRGKDSVAMEVWDQLSFLCDRSIKSCLPLQILNGREFTALHLSASLALSSLKNKAGDILYFIIFFLSVKLTKRPKSTLKRLFLWLISLSGRPQTSAFFCVIFAKNMTRGRIGKTKRTNTFSHLMRLALTIKKLCNNARHFFECDSNSWLFISGASWKTSIKGFHIHQCLDVVLYCVNS